MIEFDPKYWKNIEIVASFYFHFFSDFLIEMYLLNRFLSLLNSLNKILKKYWKMEKKYWKSHEKVREICQSENVGTMLCKAKAYTVMNCPSCGVLHHCRHLWTILLATDLITETSYLAHMPLVYAHELLNQCDLYFSNGSHFS